MQNELLIIANSFDLEFIHPRITRRKIQRYIERNLTERSNTSLSLYASREGLKMCDGSLGCMQNAPMHASFEGVKHGICGTALMVLHMERKKEESYIWNGRKCSIRSVAEEEVNKYRSANAFNERATMRKQK